MPEQSHPTGAVFISYCSQDAPAAERICEALRAVGVDVWLDKSELRGGDAWDAKIKKHIHDCAIFIPVISAHTNARAEGYFRREWKQATRRLQDMADDVAFLVPVVVDETREQDARVPEEFLSAQWTWLRGGETPPAFAQRVRHLLGADSAIDKRAELVAPKSTARKTFARKRGVHPLQLVGLTFGAVLVIGAGAYWIFQSTGDPSDAKRESAAALPTVAEMVDEKSIAVLPFADMSAEKNQEYMSDGIAEELLNLLAKAPQLIVIARTSSFAFKGEKIEIAEIARKLNVAHLVEGSIRKDGNRVRITAQLIRASDSANLWSETYNRTLEDIFAVQDEIAGAIAQALQIRLMGGQLGHREGGTQNLEAYQLYLRALDASNEGTKASVEAADRYLNQAVKFDPSYSKAWALLSDNTVDMADIGLLDTIESYERARQLAQHALKLSPDLADAHASLAQINLVFDWNWIAAEAGLRRALEIDPACLMARNTAGRLYTALGRFSDAEREYRTALTRDPLDPYLILNLGLANYLAGNFSESEAVYGQLLEVEPQFVWTRSYLGKTLLARGKPDAALQIVRQESDESIRLLYLPIMLHAAGLRHEADEALKAQIAAWAETGAYFVATTYAYHGNHDLAFEWLERAYKQKDPGLIEITGEPLLEGIADDARFKTFLRRMNLPDVW